MDSSQIRAEARKSLTNKWGKGAILTLIYVILTYLIGAVCNIIPFVGPIAYVVISVPITYGMIVCFIKLKRGEEFGYLDFFSIGFSSFGKVWSVTLHTALKMIVPIILMVVFVVIIMVAIAGMVAQSAISYSSHYSTSSSLYASQMPEVSGGVAVLIIVCYIGMFATSIYAVVKGLLFALNNYILYDNPNMAAKEIVEKSASLMKGNRGKLFILQLSFIGWAILASFTFGIGYLWLLPYMMVAVVVFYENLTGISNKSNNQQEVIEEPQNDPIQ